MNLSTVQDREIYTTERELENEQLIRRPSLLHQQALVSSRFEAFTATVTDLVYELNGRSPIRHIAIVRALPGLGDLLCATPTWRAMRAAFPEARIALIGLSQMRPVTGRFSHYVDDFLPFPGFPGLKEKPVQIPELLTFLSSVQGRFDLALQMHGSGVISNSFTMLLGARRTAGFYLPGHYCPDASTFLPYPAHLSETQRYLALLKFLGIPAQGDELEFPLQERDHADFEALSNEGLLPDSPYVCLHPGASQPAKRWPPTHFAYVGDMLASWGFQIVLTGTEREKPLTTAVATLMKTPAINLAGRTSLGALALVLQNGRLLISNDTGVSHLAAALSIPSIIVFHPSSDIPRWAPSNRGRHRVVVGSNKTASAVIRHFDYANDQPDGPDITAVLVEARSLLDEEKTYAV